MSKKKSWLNKGEGLLYSEKFEYGRIYHHLSHLAKNRFKWEGLPNGLESRFIEEGLFRNGQVFFVEDENLGLLCLPCSTCGNLNVYGEPVRLNVLGIGYHKQYDIEEGVRLVANEECVPEMLTVRYYSELLQDIEDTMRLNLDQQKFPYIIPTSKDNELSMKNMYNKIREGEPAIFVDKRVSQGGDNLVSVLQTNAPYLLRDLTEYKKEIMSEVLTYLGINNSNIQKRERVLQDEVNSNNNEILTNLELAFMYRENVAKELNKKYGLNITVKKVMHELELDFLGAKKLAGSEVEVDG